MTQIDNPYYYEEIESGENGTARHIYSITTGFSPDAYNSTISYTNPAARPFVGVNESARQRVVQCWNYCEGHAPSNFELHVNVGVSNHIVIKSYRPKSVARLK